MNISSNITLHEPPGALRFVTQAYVAFLLVAFALLPAQFIGYLHFFQDPG